MASVLHHQKHQQHRCEAGFEKATLSVSNVSMPPPLPLKAEYVFSFPLLLLPPISRQLLGKENNIRRWVTFFFQRGDWEPCQKKEQSNQFFLRIILE